MTTVTGLLMAIAVAGALLAVSLKNVLHAIFGLAITLLALAGLFVVLNSPFVAAMEVLIYVGGISVAMVFAVMLSTVVPRHAAETKLRRGGAALVAFAFIFAVGAVIVSSPQPRGALAAASSSPPTDAAVVSSLPPAGRAPAAPAGTAPLSDPSSTASPLAGATGSRPSPSEDLWSIEHLGTTLLDDYNLVFEALSVVLLLAIIGAIVISRRDEEYTGP